MKSTLSVIILSLGCNLYLSALTAADQPPHTRPASSFYTLGPDDEISITVVELPEFTARSYHIDADGTVSLPLIGRVQAAGLTLSEFERELGVKLQSHVRDPHVVTSLVETRSVPISVMGAVNNPGTQQLQGQKSLFDVLAASGGLKTEAGDIITITRQADQGPLNIPGAARDPSTGQTVADVRVHDVVDLKDPHANIIIRPHDEISVSRAKVLYVIGNVKKAGGFTLNEKNTLSCLEALSLAEGLAPNAKPSKPRILRRKDATTTARLEFAGMQGDLRPYYWTADAFVFPSCYETFSLVAHEAVAAGLPLIATPVNGVEETLHDHENGLVIERSVESISHAICQLLALNADQRRAMSGAARRSAERYSVENFVAAWGSFYELLA